MSTKERRICPLLSSLFIYLAFLPPIFIGQWHSSGIKNFFFVSFFQLQRLTVYYYNNKSHSNCSPCKELFISLAQIDVYCYYQFCLRSVYVILITAEIWSLDLNEYLSKSRRAYSDYFYCILKALSNSSESLRYAHIDPNTCIQVFALSLDNFIILDQHNHTINLLLLSLPHFAMMLLSWP